MRRGCEEQRISIYFTNKTIFLTVSIQNVKHYRDTVEGKRILKPLFRGGGDINFV